MTTCPWPECGKPIGGQFFLCSGHWRALDRGLQAEVSAAFRRLKRAVEASDGSVAHVGRCTEARKHLATVQARVLQTAVADALP